MTDLYNGEVNGVMGFGYYPSFLSVAETYQLLTDLQRQTSHFEAPV